MTSVFFGDQALLFTLPAFVGTLFFVLRLGLMLIGGDGGLDVDDGLSADFDSGDSTSAFKAFSIQAITAFIMGFGWGGLGAYRGSGLPLLVSVPIGIAFGVGTMWALAKMLRWLMRLQSSGTVDKSAALFEQGTVYNAIPEQGQGRGMVRVVIDNRMRFYHAVSDGVAIPSRTAVRITAVNDDNTVTRAEELLS
jgi:hypothetical protein